MDLFDLSYKSLLEYLHHWGPKIIKIIIILLGIFILRIILRTALKKLIRSLEKVGGSIGRLKTLTTVIGGLIEIGLWGLGTALILGELGINLGPILAAAGIVGLAVGFGAQSLVKDVISGFFFLLEDQVRVGDVVEAGGKTGLVESVTLRTLTLRNFAGDVFIIPHGEITTITNMTKTFSRCVIEIGVAYRENTDEVLRLLSEESQKLKENPEFAEIIIDNPEVYGIERFDDSAVVFKVRFTVAPGKQWNVARTFRRLVKDRFDAEGIEIPFPHRTLYWGEDKDGNAAPLRLLSQTADNESSKGDESAK